MCETRQIPVPSGSIRTTLHKLKGTWLVIYTGLCLLERLGVGMAPPQEHGTHPLSSDIVAGASRYQKRKKPGGATSRWILVFPIFERAQVTHEDGFWGVKRGLSTSLEGTKGPSDYSSLQCLDSPGPFKTGVIAQNKESGHDPAHF